jgi:broad specificity phosphatase PhoE
MILILIRHGQADGEGDSPLSEKGIAQAVAVAKKLSNINITKVYTSNYARAQGTYLEYQKLKPHIPVIVDPDLKEIYRFIVGGPIKEGTRENRAEEDTARAEKVIKELLENNDDEVIAIFSHGNIMRYMLAKALGIKPKYMWSGVTLNCGSISVIQVKNDTMNAKMINGIDHLSHTDVNDFYTRYEETKYLT